MRRGELDVAVWIVHAARTGQRSPRATWPDDRRLYAAGKREFARQQRLVLISENEMSQKGKK